MFPPRLLGLPLAAVLLTVSVSSSVRAAAADLDPTYGNSGKVLPNNTQAIYDAAIQPDGKTVAVGLLSVPEGGFRPGAFRLKVDGSLDTSFGDQGRVLTVLGAGAVVLQPDGKIVIGGGANGDFAVARLNSNGSYDKGFGIEGLAILDFSGPDWLDGIFGLALQPDGKILAVGAAHESAFFALARFNANGSLDTSFGQGGKFAPGICPGIEQGLAVTIQQDQKIVAVGLADNLGQTRNDFAILRLMPNGEFDQTFGDGGKVFTDFDGWDNANAVVIQPDGKVVAAGLGNWNFGIARYNSDGSLDASFGVNGKVTTSFFGRGDSASSLVLQPTGKLVAAGGATVSGGLPAPGTAIIREFALVRYEADGSIDPTFGKTISNFGEDSFAHALVAQPDGRLVAAGGVFPPGYGIGALARFMPPETMVPTLQVEADFQHALALDSVTLASEPFSVINENNFSTDHRTRILLFATNLGKTNGTFPTVTVEARNTSGAILTLPVEYVGEVVGLEWMTQVVVKLPDELSGAGPVKLSLGINSQSNQGIVLIK